MARTSPCILFRYYVMMVVRLTEKQIRTNAKLMASDEGEQYFFLNYLNDFFCLIFCVLFSLTKQPNRDDFVGSPVVH